MDEARFEIPATGPLTFARAPLASDLRTSGAQVAVVGVPWDWGVGFRPGARFGPRAIREASLRFPLGRPDRRGGYWDVEA
ncbi:MAG: arginase family protein, partial [Chloroflexi bacterium]|nr:arginase family protein [Chloroflexota bacterium]